MVVKALREMTAPITVAAAARLIGIDPGTLRERISEGLFPTRTLIMVGPDIRIDPSTLADEIEQHQGEERTGWCLEWRAIGSGIDGYLDGKEVMCWAEARMPSQLVELVRHMSHKTWITKRDLVYIVAVWSETFGGGQ